MSSVTVSEKCPQCGGVYTVDFDCRTYEEDSFCERCGKSVGYYIVTNDDSEPILDENGELKYLYEETEGYGCICIGLKKRGFIVDTVDESADLEELKAEYLISLENPDVDKDSSYFTYWDAEKEEIVVIFGEDPGTYEEYEKRIANIELPFDQEHLVVTEEDIPF